MKILVTCHLCAEELLGSGLKLGSEEFEAKHWFQHMDVNDEGFYTATCPKGHAIACTLSNRNYEILFDRAACALLDGYYREAIATFASALERCFEFYVRVVARHLGLAEQKIALFWKPIGNRSERQLGAFYMAYLIQNKTAFSGVQPKMEELRNDVVHKGIFATHESAYAYGAYVYDTIWHLLEGTQKDMPRAMEEERDAAYFSEVRKGVSRTGHKGNVGGIGLATIIQGGGSKTRSFQEALDWFDRHSPWNIGGYDTRLGKLAQGFGLTVRQYLRELASGKYAAAFALPTSRERDDSAPPQEGGPASV